MKLLLTCFKCHQETAVLTYEENRMYKVSCPCGCEYTFEHSSMACAESYHLREVELHGEIDRNKDLAAKLSALQTESADLREENDCLQHNVAAMQATLDQQAKNCETLIAEKDKELARAEAERDAAVNELRESRLCVGALSMLIKALDGRTVMGAVKPMAVHALERYRTKYPSGKVTLDGGAQGEE